MSASRSRSTEALRHRDVGNAGGHALTKGVVVLGNTAYAALRDVPTCAQHPQLVLTRLLSLRFPPHGDRAIISNAAVAGLPRILHAPLVATAFKRREPGSGGLAPMNRVTTSPHEPARLVVLGQAGGAIGPLEHQNRSPLAGPAGEVGGATRVGAAIA